MEKTRTGLTTTKALMAGAALITLSAGVTSKAEAATGTGAASAIILTPIIVAGAALHFGSVTESGLGGTVVMDTANGRTVTGAVTAVVGGALEQSGVITVTAANGLAINLSMGATSIAVSNGVATMAVNNFNIRTNAGGVLQVVTLAASPETFPLGATLNVGAGQDTSVGLYTGAYTLNANYQ
jgi:hypothetical protein